MFWLESMTGIGMTSDFMRSQGCQSIRGASTERFCVLDEDAEDVDSQDEDGEDAEDENAEDADAEDADVEDELMEDEKDAEMRKRRMPRTSASSC
jgi:hypothetical protein